MQLPAVTVRLLVTVFAPTPLPALMVRLVAVTVPHCSRTLPLMVRFVPPVRLPSLRTQPAPCRVMALMLGAEPENTPADRQTWQLPLVKLMLQTKVESFSVFGST